MTNPFTSFFRDLETVSACLEARDNITSTGRFLDLKEKLMTVTPAEKKLLGAELNELRKFVQSALDEKIQEIQEIQEKDNFHSFDPTFYSDKYQKTTGNLHPVTLVMDEIVQAFVGMGFDIADGPLVESQWYCFTSLNMPSYHPARAMQDTFYLENKDPDGEQYVMRTHTSNMQIRYGESHKPPFWLVAPGQVYRNENIDATHDIVFHQIECLVVDEKVSISHLKTILANLFSEIFEDQNIKIRFRPSYFPYTIPSMEYDISCPFCHGSGCRVCKHTKWIEIGGAGMVHPDVIKNMNIDSEKYQGFAFGFGVDRVAQFKLDISGMAQFFNGQVKFLNGK